MTHTVRPPLWTPTGRGPDRVTLTLQTMHGQKVHGLIWGGATTYTVCDLLVQPGDKMLPRERKVTCKKCLRTLDREGA